MPASHRYSRFFIDPRLTQRPSRPANVVIDHLSRASSSSEEKQKTQEEYLLGLHDKLLEARKEATDFINSYMIAVYGLLGLLALFFTKAISEISIAGVKLNLQDSYLPEYIQILVCLAYTLIAFHLMRLGRLFRAITRNAVELSKLNPHSRVVGVRDMNLFVSGIAGIMLAPARSQTIWMLSTIGKLPIQFLQNFVAVIINLRKNPNAQTPWNLTKVTVAFFAKLSVPSWQAGQVVWRIGGASLVFYLPVVGAAYSLVAQKYGHLNIAIINYAINIDPFDQGLGILTISIVAYSTYAWINLCLSYSVDALITLINDWNKSWEELRAQLGIPDTVLPLEIARLRSIIQDW